MEKYIFNLLIQLASQILRRIYSQLVRYFVEYIVSQLDTSQNIYQLVRYFVEYIVSQLDTSQNIQLASQILLRIYSQLSRYFVEYIQLASQIFRRIYSQLARYFVEYMVSQLDTSQNIQLASYIHIIDRQQLVRCIIDRSLASYMHHR